LEEEKKALNQKVDRAEREACHESVVTPDESQPEKKKSLPPGVTGRRGTGKKGHEEVPRCGLTHGRTHGGDGEKEIEDDDGRREKSILYRRKKSLSFRKERIYIR
jgi:hypothetical protein